MSLNRVIQSVLSYNTIFINFSMFDIFSDVLKNIFTFAILI